MYNGNNHKIVVDRSNKEEKTKKLTSLLLVLFAALLLAGCSCDQGGNGGEQEEQKEKFLGGYASLVDSDGYKYQYDSKVKDGYISLANKFANAPAEGKAGWFRQDLQNCWSRDCY